MATLCVRRHDASPASLLIFKRFYRFNLNLLNGEKKNLDLVKVKEVIICAVRNLYLLFYEKPYLSTHVFFLSFCLSIFPVPYGLTNPLQFLFSFAHMKISIEKKEGL